MAGNTPRLKIDARGFRYETMPGAGCQVGPKQETLTWVAMRMVLDALGLWTEEALAGARRKTTRASTLPLLATFRHGFERSHGGLISNPRFFEWMMGWPIGWTDARAPVTGFARWLRRSRSAFSKLISEWPEDPFRAHPSQRVVTRTTKTERPQGHARSDHVGQRCGRGHGNNGRTESARCRVPAQRRIVNHSFTGINGAGGHYIWSRQPQGRALTASAESGRAEPRPGRPTPLRTFKGGS
jgi:hypothetical protein